MGTLIQGLRAASVALALACASCVSTGGSVSNTKEMPRGPWLAPSPLLAQQIDDESQRLPWTHGLERVELIRWFASVGEPAYPKLLELAEDPRNEVAAAALAALGATGDRRLVPSLQRLSWSSANRGADLGLERSRALVRLGDWSALPALIQGLRDDRSFTRSLCAQALQEATRQDFGYDAKAPKESRELAVQRWERWWLARGGDELLSERTVETGTR